MMKRLKTATCLVPVLIFAPALPVSSQTDVEKSLYRIEADDSSLIVPVEVSYERTDGKRVVAGRIEKRWSYYGRMPGHVDVALSSDRGEVILDRRASVYKYSPCRRTPYRARFSVTLDSVPTAVTAIRLRHHFGGDS